MMMMIKSLVIGVTRAPVVERGRGEFFHLVKESNKS